MSCQEAFFADAHCRIDIEPRPDAAGEARFAATLAIVDPSSHALRPLVFRDGSRVTIPASSEALALNSAVTYLEKRFGAFSEIAYGCLPDVGDATVGRPLVIEDESIPATSST